MPEKIIHSHVLNEGTICPICGGNMIRERLITAKEIKTPMGTGNKTIDYAECEDCEYWYPINKDGRAYW